MESDLLWESINSVLGPTVGIHQFCPRSYCGNPHFTNSAIIVTYVIALYVAIHFKTLTKYLEIILYALDVFSGMLSKIAIFCVSFAALVALERLLPSVCYHVFVQSTRRGACVVALVTLVWLFSCVVPHHVSFQITSLNAGKPAHCASVRLFPRVGPVVPLQIA